MKEDKLDMLHAKAGMVISRSIYDDRGRLLLPADFVLTPKAIMLLKSNAVDEIYIKKVIEHTFVQNMYESNRIERIRQTDEFKAFDRAHGESVNVVREVLNNMLTVSSKIDASILLEEIDKILSMNRNNIQVFDMLHCIRDYDDSTYVHCVNVALICNVMGKWLNYSKNDIEALTLAGLLHDTGKLMMPKEIITKPGRLTSEEFNIIKTHSYVGYQMLAGEKLDERVKLAALQHHEKCDGSGYPDGLKADQIDRLAKIVAIADVYDAMTADRVYRPGLCPFDVIDIFEEEGLQKYDANDLLVFLEHIVESYVNKEVLLSDGSEGKIILINKRRLARPVVHCGSKYIDLSRDSSIAIKAVL